MSITDRAPQETVIVKPTDCLHLNLHVGRHQGKTRCLDCGSLVWLMAVEESGERLEKFEKALNDARLTAVRCDACERVCQLRDIQLVERDGARSALCRLCRPEYHPATDRTVAVREK